MAQTVEVPGWGKILLNILAVVVLVGATFGLDLIELRDAIAALVVLIPALIVAATQVIDAFKRIAVSKEATGEAFSTKDEIEAQAHRL
jgi:hypothetical protein